jgi:hypothetical protein
VEVGKFVEIRSDLALRLIDGGRSRCGLAHDQRWQRYK